MISPDLAGRQGVSPTGLKENVFPASGKDLVLVRALVGRMHVEGRPELCRFVLGWKYAGDGFKPGGCACLAGQCYLGLWQVRVRGNYFLSPGSIIVMFSASAIR